jgi:hypothetical protein
MLTSPILGLKRMLGQVAVADHHLTVILEPLFGILRQESRQRGLDCLGDQVTSSLAQQLVHRISGWRFLIVKELVRPSDATRGHSMLEIGVSRSGQFDRWFNH